MARRQHTLTTPVVIPSLDGSSFTCDLVRIVSANNDPLNKRYNVSAVGGCVDTEDEWESGPVGAGKNYSGADYDTLIGQATPAAMEDKIYQDLVADGQIGPGTQGNY